MALFKSCCCCSLLQGSIVTGVYTTVVYVAAFILELCLVLEGENWMNSGKDNGPLPLPGYILVVLHFTIVGLSVIMLYALYQRRNGVLLAWVFIMCLLFFPELGMVLFLATFHWGLTNLFGISEIVFYLVRAPVNIVCILCVYSLYSLWKCQLETQKSLNKLSSLQMMQDMDSTYKNDGYLSSTNDVTLGQIAPSTDSESLYLYPKKYPTLPLKKSRLSGSLASLDIQNGGNMSRGFLSGSQFSDYRNYYVNPPFGMRPNWYPYYQSPIEDNRSEFNASIFPGSKQPQGLVYTGMGQLGYPAGYIGRGYDMYDMGAMSKSLLHLEYGHSRRQTAMDYSTQSLDRRYLRRGNNFPLDQFTLPKGFRTSHPLYYGYGHPHLESKSSIGAESDDFRRYRDVAL